MSKKFLGFQKIKINLDDFRGTRYLNHYLPRKKSFQVDAYDILRYEVDKEERKTDLKKMLQACSKNRIIVNDQCTKVLH